MQIRTTSQAAKLLNIKRIDDLNDVNQYILDDWYLDAISIDNNVFYVLMHIESRIATLLSESDVANVRIWEETFPTLISYILSYQSLEKANNIWCNIFHNGYEVFKYTKANIHSITKHIALFKRITHTILKKHKNCTVEMIQEVSKKWAETPINMPNIENIKPIEMLQIILMHNDIYKAKNVSNLSEIDKSNH